MKIRCVLSACNTNSMYMDFIPIFIRSWKKLFPEVEIKIIIVAKRIPNEYVKFSENLILFPPEGVPDAFVSQYIRLLYPAILKLDCGVIITDIDILPMSRDYYIRSLENLNQDCFVSYREILTEWNELAICYNAAAPRTWAEIFNVHSLSDVRERLRSAYASVSYDGKHGGQGWSTDQRDLLAHLRRWPAKEERWKILKDRDTGFNRLDRSERQLRHLTWFSRAPIAWLTRRRIRCGYYTDFHAFRPYADYKSLNESVVDALGPRR